jgi:hypothetical protein
MAGDGELMQQRNTALADSMTVAISMTQSCTHANGWVGRTARFPQFAGPFPYGPPPNRTCQLSRHPALW